jgi:hypothetical protein
VTRRSTRHVTTACTVSLNTKCLAAGHRCSGGRRGDRNSVIACSRDGIALPKREKVQTLGRIARCDRLGHSNRIRRRALDKRCQHVQTVRTHLSYGQAFDCVNIACYADQSRHSCATAEIACRRITRHFFPSMLQRFTPLPVCRLSGDIRCVKAEIGLQFNSR